MARARIAKLRKQHASHIFNGLLFGGSTGSAGELFVHIPADERVVVGHLKDVGKSEFLPEYASLRCELTGPVEKHHEVGEPIYMTTGWANLIKHREPIEKQQSALTQMIHLHAPTKACDVHGNSYMSAGKMSKIVFKVTELADGPLIAKPKKFGRFPYNSKADFRKGSPLFDAMGEEKLFGGIVGPAACSCQGGLAEANAKGQLIKNWKLGKGLKISSRDFINNSVSHRGDMSTKKISILWRPGDWAMGCFFMQTLPQSSYLQGRGQCLHCAVEGAALVGCPEVIACGGGKVSIDAFEEKRKEYQRSVSMSADVLPAYSLKTHPPELVKRAPLSNLLDSYYPPEQNQDAKLGSKANAVETEVLEGERKDLAQNQYEEEAYSEDEPVDDEPTSISTLALVIDDSDVASIRSIGPFSGSAASTLVNPAILAAADEFVDLLLQDEILSPLFPVAFGRITAAKLERNLGRLVKQYALDLKAEASDALEREAFHLVRSRARYIAGRIRWQFDLTQTDHYAGIDQLQGQVTNKKPILERYLRGEKMAEPGAVNGQSVDRQNEKMPDARGLNESNLDLGDNDSNEGDLDPPSDSEQDGLDNLNRVKAFMIQSAAFSKLRNDFRLFVFPDLKDPMAELKDERIARLSTTTWGRLRAKVSEFSFLIRLLFRPSLSPGYQRITWICVSSTAAPR